MIERVCVAAWLRVGVSMRSGVRGRNACTISEGDVRACTTCVAKKPFAKERPKERSVDKRAQIAVSNASVGVPARASACRRHERASAHLLQQDTHSDDLEGQGERVQREVLKPKVPFTTDDRGVPMQVRPDGDAVAPARKA
jgi:hypothetical protein